MFMKLVADDDAMSGVVNVSMSDWLIGVIQSNLPSCLVVIFKMTKIVETLAQLNFDCFPNCTFNRAYGTTVGISNG